jgi:DNA-directed RNA polymerase subunit RPC12/RpoP
MNKNLSEQKCPTCGAPLRYDPESGRSVCDWCGSSFDIPTAEDASLAEGEAAAPAQQADELPVYNCKSCGAELITDAVSASITCPYCGNNIVLTEKVSGGLRPDGVIPFKIDKKRLPAAVQSFYKNKKLLPRRFFSESNIEDLYGVYVPFWIYNCTLSGPVYYDAYRDAAIREGDYIVTTRSHFDVERNISMDFRDIPVDASQRLDDALMDSLEPFDYNDIVPFRMSYLSGFLAERFDKDSDEVKKRAEDRMMNSALGIANANARGDYSEIVNKGNGLVADPLETKYVLLPVYTFNVNYKGQKYSFAMNGETGKVVGDLPVDKGVSALHRWGVFGAIFLIVMLLINFISC